MDQLTRRLRSLRAHLRRLYFLAGGMRLLLEVMLYLSVAFAMDRWVLFPRGVRIVLLVLGLGLLAYRTWRLLWYPLRRKIAVEDMALAVERQHRELSGELASAVELSGVSDAPPADVSPALLAQWLAQVEQRARSIAFQDIFRYARLQQLGALTAVVLAIVLVQVARAPTETGIFLQRLLGANLDWPRRTHLTLSVPGDSHHYRVERDGERVIRVLVAKGGSLPVLVEARGVVPEEVFLVVDETDRIGRSEEVRMLPREDEEGVFAYRFRNVLRPVEIHPRGGDDPGRDDVLTIEVTPPPTVERLIATMTPPAYMGMDVVREEREDFHVPAGTVLDLEIETIGKVAEGTVTWNNDPGTAEPLQVDPEKPSMLLHSLTVRESGTFNLHLVGENGFRNLQPLDYVVTATQDRRPTLEISRPGISHLEVTSRGVVPFELRVSDDHGVADVTLSLHRFGNEQESARLSLWESTDPLTRVAGERVPIHYALDLLTFQLPRGGRLDALAQGETAVYVLEATDNRHDADGKPDPNTLKVQPRSIELVGEGEKMRKLGDRQLRLKQTVDGLRQSQQEKLDGLNEMRKASAQELAGTDAREFTALEVDQTRIASRAEQVSRDLAEIVEEYLLNRLDQSPTAERALLMRLEQLKAGSGSLRFDPAPFQELVEAQASGQFGELDVLGNLLEMLGLALLASHTHAEQALVAVRTARVTADLGERPRLLEESAASQQAFLDTYARLLEKMQEWEDFQEILEQMRTVLDLQKRVNESYKESFESDGAER